MEPTQEGPPQRPVRPKILDEGSGEPVAETPATPRDGTPRPIHDEVLDAIALLGPTPPLRPIRPIPPERPPDAAPEAEKHTLEQAGRLEVEPPSPRGPATERRSNAPAEKRVPCHECGYDLRASVAGSRCPECGTIVPTREELELWEGANWNFRDEIRAAFRATPDAARDAVAERRRLREEQLDAWNGLATASLAAIALVSPLPFLGSIGLVAAAAMVFAPLFRLIHLRTLAAAPAPIVSRLDRALARAQAANLVEIAIGGVVALFAIAGTLATLPANATRAYPVLIAAWWSFATLSLLRQVEFGAASNRLFTPPSLAALRPPRRIHTSLIGGAGAAIVGVTLVTAANLLPNSLGATLLGALKTLGVLASLGGMTLFAFGAVRAWSFLSTVSRCAFESPVFQQLRTKAPDLDALPDGVARHAKTPDHGPPVVEVIELPPPSAEFLAGKDDGSNDDKIDARPRDRDA